ncbi:hypothetical protein FBU30_000132 [Linnemannia zychae]|nr:hypothetical protein FBU30_000132 [Linnemannia zychae]
MDQYNHPSATSTSHHNQQPHSNQQQQQEQQQQPQPAVASHEPVHCFWALMTYGDLKFIYLSSSVQRAVSSKYKQLLGKSFFDYIHPDEAKLARKDLNAFMDVHNLYGSVTRCRFRNVCPEWEQRRLARRSKSPGSTTASAAHNAANEEDLSSGGLGLNRLQHSINSGSGSGTKTEGCKDYGDIFQNSEDDEFIILDVVMNVVSDEVVLGFFHIDGQGLYKGFWSNGICGESKESLPTLAPEILRDLQESVKTRIRASGSQRGSTSDNDNSPPSSPPRKTSDSKTKRIFQIYDSHNRNLLLTWPEPGPNSPDAGTMAYNPELYTQIVKSHHIPSDALDNTTCLKRFCSKHALPSLNPSQPEPSYQVESVFIPYGHIIFACFQTSPSTPSNTWLAGSPTASIVATQGSQVAAPSPGQRPFGSTFEGGSPADQLSGLGLMPSPGQLSSSLFGMSGHQATSSALNSPLIIPSLPSVSPFLKHAVAGQMAIPSGQAPSPSPTGPIRSTSGSHTSPYHPYSRTLGLTSTLSGTPSPSSLPLPEAMQESLRFLNDYKADGETDRDRTGKTGSAINESPSIWHASTPHPAIAAMVGHALQPSSPSFQRSVTGSNDIRGSHSRQKSAGTAEARLHSSLAILEDAHKLGGSGKEKDAKIRKTNASPRHPAHDAAIRNKSLSSGSSSSPPSSYQDVDSAAMESSSTSGHNGHVLRVAQEEKACESCGTTNSPEWRRGQSGKKDLCNACGLRYSRSVARQNRQAQKQLEGKLPKTKAPKGAKAAKAAAAAAAAAAATATATTTASSQNKGESVDREGSEMTASSDHYNHGYMQQDLHQQPRPHSHQQQQHPPHQQQMDLPYGSASFSAPGIVSGYPVAINHSTFYHGQ